MSLAIMNPGRGWLRSFPVIEPARPCGCQADITVFGHTACQAGPPPRTDEYRGGYCEPVR
jgi:hypothetical protein